MLAHVVPRARKKQSRYSSTFVPVRKTRPFCKGKKWTNEAIVAAMEAVKNNIASFNKCADLYGVPHTTLKDRLTVE